MSTFVSPVAAPSTVKLLNFFTAARVRTQIYHADKYVPPQRQAPKIIRQNWRFYITGRQTGSDNLSYDDGEFVLEVEFNQGPVSAYVRDLTKVSVYSDHPMAGDVEIDRAETLGDRNVRFWFRAGQDITRFDSGNTYYVRFDKIDDGFGNVFSADTSPIEFDELGNWAPKADQTEQGDDIGKAANFMVAVPTTVYGGDNLDKILPAVLRAFGFEFERLYGQPATRNVEAYKVNKTGLDGLGKIFAQGDRIILETCLDFPKKGGDVFIDGHRFIYKTWTGPKKDGTYEMPSLFSYQFPFLEIEIPSDAFVILDTQELRPEFDLYEKEPVDAPWSGAI